MRLWPNRVLVRVAERKPVAFVTLSGSRYGLIDEDGVILPPATDRFHLPVLQGSERDAILWPTAVTACSACCACCAPWAPMPTKSLKWT